MICRLVAFWIAAATPLVSAQDRSTYPTNRSPDQFRIDWIEFYDRIDAWTTETRKQLDHRLDVSYGPDAKQKLDLYLPPQPRGPVLLFIHGGGFVEGDRAHYGYVARALSEIGVLTAVMSYRLSPHHYPAQAEDTRLAVTWLYRNIARFGGEPGSLFLCGHSAGAILSAYVSVSRNWMSEVGIDPSAIRGVVPISGPYDLREFGSFVDVYLPDGTDRETASPALAIEASRPPMPPMIVAFGSEEDVFREPSVDFVERLQAARGSAELLELSGGHDDTAMALWDRDSPLFRAVEALIRDRSP